MDLSLASLQELTDELLSRADHGLVVLLINRTEDSNGDGEQMMYRQWKGNSWTCCGLSNHINLLILDDLDYDDSDNVQEEF
jgi:hypothetical protein